MFDPSTLPDFELREKAVALLEAAWAAGKLRDDADPHISDEEFRVLDDAADAAYQAYQDFDAPGLYEDYDGEIVRCGVCAVPLFGTDEVVEDKETGEVFLRVALSLPPRKIEAEAQLLPDMEGATA